MVNAGVYAFNPGTFANAQVRACSMERDLLPGLLAGEGIGVLEYAGRFIDIGTPESLGRYVNDFHGDAMS